MLNSEQNAFVANLIARFTSLATFLFIANFIVGDLTSGQSQMPPSDEWLGFLFFPVGLLAGLAVGWWKELPGGLTAIMSVAAFYVWKYSRTGTWPGGPWLLLLAAPGLIFVLAGLIRKTESGMPTEQNAHSAPA